MLAGSDGEEIDLAARFHLKGSGTPASECHILWPKGSAPRRFKRFDALNS